MSATLGSYQEALGQNVLPDSFGLLAAFSSRPIRRRPLFSGRLWTQGCSQLLEVDRVPWQWSLITSEPTMSIKSFPSFTSRWSLLLLHGSFSSLASSFSHDPFQVNGYCSQPFLTDGMCQFSSVARSCPTLCDPINHSTPGLPVHHQLLEFTQTHVHRVSRSGRARV